MEQNGKLSGNTGVKRSFREIDCVADEISVVLMGRNVERNKYITLKNDPNELPKIGHVKRKWKCFYKIYNKLTFLSGDIYFWFL